MASWKPAKPRPLGRADRCERHILKNCLVGEQVERLEYHANLSTQAGELLAFLRQRFSINANITGINGFQTVDGAAHRGLAGTGWTDYDQHFALLDGEVDILEHMQVTIVLFNVGQFDQRSVAVFRARHNRARLLRFFDICHTDSIWKPCFRGCYRPLTCSKYETALSQNAS